MARESIEVNETLIAKLDLQIEKAIGKYQVELDLLQTIDGIGKDSAIAIISEIGVDMEQFPNEHHLASWSVVSPGNNESGGKKKYKNHPREQTLTNNLNTKCMGSHSKKRRLLQTKISQIARAKRSQKSYCCHQSQTYYCSVSRTKQKRSV
jgi:transposase